MASRIFKTAVSIVLAAYSANAQLATPTPNGNLSVSATPSPGPTATGGSCCVVVPMNVGLNFWFNSTLTRTVATVVTQIYLYNTTAVTSTITVSHNGSYDDVPASIIPGQFIYSMTMTGTTTEVSLANTLVASPTPFVEIVNVGVIYGTWSMSSNKPTCDETTNEPLIVLPTGYGYVEDPPISRTTHAAYANPPPGTDLLDFWIQHEPTITEKFPGLKTCSIPSGSGEPSVHVPVTGLTDHVTSTIRMGGGGPAPPVSKTKVPAEPITTKEPATSKAPEPGPTSKTPAKPSEPERPPPVPTASISNPDPNPNNPQQPPNPENPQQPPNPSSPQQPPNPDSSQHLPNPQQPPPATTGSNPNPSGNPNPNSPQQPAPTAPGQPGNSNPSSPNLSQGPIIPLPINLTPVPAPALGPTTAGAPPVATQPINPPAVILPNGETLQPGTLTTISDHTISIPTDASSATISNDTPVQGPPIVVVDGTTATLAPSAVILPNGEILQPGTLTTISDHTVSIPTDIPSMTVVNGTPVQAPPIVVVDGTTATLAPTGVAAPVAIPITVGEGASASEVSITAAPTPGRGVVLPNGETLLPGSTITYLGETLVLTTASEGGSTVVQVIDSSTTEIVTVPTAASSSVFVYGNGSGTTTGSSGGSGTPSQTTSSAPEEATGAGKELSPQGVGAMLAVMGAAVVFGL